MLVRKRDAAAIAERIDRHGEDQDAAVSHKVRSRRRIREHRHFRLGAEQLAKRYGGPSRSPSPADDTRRMINRRQPPLVLHVINRLAVGGLENGLVNLLNHLPPARYRHAIVCLTDATDFRERLQRGDIEIIQLHKRPGQDLTLHARFWRVLRARRPDVVHTRNFSALEYLVTATAAGVPGRVHGEHGRDVYDLDGLRLRYNLVRKAVRPFVHRYIAVSRELEHWLVTTVGARPERVTRVCNGVDMSRFRPGRERTVIGPPGFAPLGTVVIGGVGRMEPVKDPLTLVRAFVHLLTTERDARARLRLVMVGGGSLHVAARALLREAHAEAIAWLPGERDDVADVMRGFDVFVLPSLREGISNTVLEAMASGLPIVATRVGGNPELVEEGVNGTLVAPGDPAALAAAVWRYAGDPALMERHGRVGRLQVESRYSMDAMVEGYLGVYDSVLRRARGRGVAGATAIRREAGQGATRPQASSR
jgi:sugar transferase (PEP-CTERM/EpsH1 system associated)